MESRSLAFIRHIPELAPLLKHADHIDVKTVTGNVDMRTFIAGMLSFSPDWIMYLYHMRAVLVQVLGMRQVGIPSSSPLHAEDVPMQKGQRASFFTVKLVKEETYWIAGVEDTHLNALLGVVIESLGGTSSRRFHVLTIVHYRNWTGPVYFQIIRPFHHLVVGSMARAGIHATSKRQVSD